MASLWLLTLLLFDKAIIKSFKIIDKVASKGVIHKNKAANQKSRISRHLNSLS